MSDNKRTRINVYVSPEIKEKAMKKADQLGISLSGLMAVALSEYMKQDSVIDMAEMFKIIQQQQQQQR